MFEFAGSTARRSPVPRPGIFPPTLKVRLLKVQVLPWLVLFAMQPLFGSLREAYLSIYPKGKKRWEGGEDVKHTSCSCTSPRQRIPRWHSVGPEPRHLCPSYA